MQRDSVSRAPDRLMVFSSRRERISSVLSCLGYISMCSESLVMPYLPTSNAGLASGLNSVLIVKTPSNFLSSYGLTTSALICTVTLVLPSRTVAWPYASPKVRTTWRYWSNGRPSMRIFCSSACRRKAFAFVLGSASRGMLCFARESVSNTS